MSRGKEREATGRTGGAPARSMRTVASTAPQSSGAFVLYLVLAVFTLLSVPSRAPGLGEARPTFLLTVLIAVLIVFRTRPRMTGDSSKTSWYLAALVGYVLVTLPLVEWPGSVLRVGLENFVKAIVFFYFTVHLVDSVRKLRVLIAVVVGCQVLRVLEPLYLHVTTGYWGSQAHMVDGTFLARLSGAPSDIINPNGLAFVVLTALPFLHYLLGGSRGIIARMLYLVLLPPLLYAFVLTGSRSGLVGLVVIGAAIVWRSPRRVLMTALLVAVGVIMAANMSDDLRERYLSLTESGTRHSETRDGRIAGWSADLAVAMRRPVFGHGLGTSAETMANFGGRAQIAHNLYTEVLLELGIVGLLLYLGLLVSILRNVSNAREQVSRAWLSGDRTRPSAESAEEGFFLRLSDAIFVWVIMCLVFSMASYGLSEFYWYMIAGMSVALVRNLPGAKRAAASASASVPVSGAMK